MVKSKLLNSLSTMMIKDVPRYGNKFFYSLGFLSMIAFMLLLASGLIMSVNGPAWWLTNDFGKYVRSIHLWATQAFVLFLLLHLLIVFLTSGFKKPRRLTWVIGIFMLFIVLSETEFGYILRGDFSSQWRALQGADFYNGSGLGTILSPLNSGQIMGIHSVVIPFVLLGLLFFHYLLVKIRGIAQPYNEKTPHKTVPANHRLLFIRGGILTGLILALGLFIPSPYIKPTTIQSVATADPYLMQKTLLSEYEKQSSTATYLDNIDPYRYDVRSIYIAVPYRQLITASPGTKNDLSAFELESQDVQNQQLAAADTYYARDTATGVIPRSPIVTAIAALSGMAKAGLYEPSLIGGVSPEASVNGNTYVLRLLADTGALESQATDLHITTDQYGMVREESGNAPGAWWLVPIGVLGHTVLAKDQNGDRDGAIIFGSVLLTMLAFPFIPFISRFPELLRIDRFIWRKEC
jgi:ubiquinol-cytochrome c reductase cytochrome b subunit